METGASEPSDASQEVLRSALAQAARIVSIKQILDLAAGPDRTRLFTDRALRDFINGETRSISKANYDLLAAAWLHTPLGRALRNLTAGSVPMFDQLVRMLADGNRQRPHGVNATGNFFMYHGSYLRPRHYVVRALTVAAEDDHILTVTDTIRDDVTLSTQNRSSSGVMVFVEGLPQVLLYGKENKHGLSLMVASRADEKDGALDRVYGAFVVKRAGGEAATRYCLMIREPELPLAAMTAETGIFSAGEIAEPSRARHREAFERLKKLVMAEAFVDPVLAYGA
jgi:hypothetical protein